MGIFRSNKPNPSFDRSAMQVRETIQPIIDELERLQESVQDYGKYGLYCFETTSARIGAAAAQSIP